MSHAAGLLARRTAPVRSRERLSSLFHRSLFSRSTVPCSTVLLSLLLLLLSTPAQAQWAFEVFFGSSVSANSPLTIRQNGYPAIHIDAQWDTRPFEPSIYFAHRLIRWWGNTGFLLDNVHHKLYLANPTVDVPEFHVTYGYNLVSLGPAFRRGEWSLITGAGPVFTNPASIVRGQREHHEGGFLGTGYFLDGAQVQVGLNRRLHLMNAVFVTTDVRLSAAWARVDVANGKADVPNYAVHFMIGMGVGNRRK